MSKDGDDDGYVRITAFGCKGSPDSEPIKEVMNERRDEVEIASSFFPSHFFQTSLLTLLLRTRIWFFLNDFIWSFGYIFRFISNCFNTWSWIYVAVGTHQDYFTGNSLLFGWNLVHYSVVYHLSGILVVVVSFISVVVPMLTFFTLPMLVRYSAGHEGTLYNDEAADCGNENERDEGGVNGRIRICIGKYVDHRISDHSTTSQRVKQVQKEFELLLCHAFLDSHHKESGNQS